MLSDMCDEQPDLRLTLTQIMQLSSSYAANHMTESFSTHIMRMYELVFGSGDNVSSRHVNHVYLLIYSFYVPYSEYLDMLGLEL